MLPECRLKEYLFKIPPFAIEKDNIRDFADELRKYHEEFSDGFAGSEPRKNFSDYMVGQSSHPERKSAEPTAVNVNGIKSVRSMQRTLSDAVWCEDRILQIHQDMVGKEMGEPDGVLTFDESGFVKKGDCPAGVAGQYCGEAGKAENCQNGVFAGYASPKGYTLLDKRLFIPEKWFGEDYKDRRIKCGFPEDPTFKSKPELAADMFRDINERGPVSFRYAAADTVCGSSSSFTDAAESVVGKMYMVSMPCDTLFWRTPVTGEQSYQYGEKPLQKKFLPKMKNPPQDLTFSQKIFTTAFGADGQYPKEPKGRLNMSSPKEISHWPKTDCPIRMSG